MKSKLQLIKDWQNYYKIYIQKELFKAGLPLTHYNVRIMA